jgi:hypothetical protein
MAKGLLDLVFAWLSFGAAQPGKSCHAGDEILKTSICSASLECRWEVMVENEP